MSDTPRVDAMESAFQESGMYGTFAPVALCRQFEREITTLRQQVAELEAAEKRYFDVFRRISEAHGISSPLVLIGKAINDDENYAEILARIVEEKQSKAESRLSAYREALEKISRAEGRYSACPLEHASNTVEDMALIALQALARDAK